MSVEDALKAASAAYELAEAEYLRLIRVRVDLELLAPAARATSVAANAWNTAEHARFVTLAETDRLQYQACYDVTEVLCDLWADIARAHEGR